jgi:hypothetical protein
MTTHDQVAKRLLAVAVAATALASCGGAKAEDARIDVRADRTLHPVSRLLTGACIEDVNHEIYGGIYSQMIFGESFQEPAISPAIRGFKLYGGSWIAGQGVMRADGGDGPKLVSDYPAFADGATGVEIFFADRKGENAGLIVRVDKPGIGADSFIGYEVSLDPARQTLRLGRHRNNYELIRDAKCQVSVGRWIPLEVRLAGATIEILVDGKSVVLHDDARQSIPAGGVGLRAWFRQAAFRNLWVKRGDRTDRLPFRQDEPPKQVSGMWRATVRGGAAGSYALSHEHPWAGVQSQQMTFESGEGEIGMENRGLNRWGMNFARGKPYEGCLWVRAKEPVTLYAAMENGEGLRTYAEQAWNVAPGDWQRLDLSLTPGATDASGRFSLKLKRPGSVTVGYAFLQSAAWGRFRGLPVRRDVAEGLIEQGITVLRYGGSMVNHAEYRWKKMIGPRDRRPPYHGTWYPYSSNGWGIVDFMDFCEAAGFEYIPAFNLGETPRDMADFVRYATAAADTPWGRRRAADGHPAPYRLKTMELGNEERVDEAYAARFEALAEAIWSIDPAIVLVVADLCYGKRIQDPFHFDGAASGITTLAAHQRILRFAKRRQGEVWFDVHVGTDYPVRVNDSLDGMFSLADALAKIADGARHKVVVFEFNAGNHAQKRALANAQAINAIQRDGRIPVATSANCLQPDGQNDNDWDQGLLFLNPSQVWLQPPGYVTQMFSRNYQPRLVRCTTAGDEGALDASAALGEDGKTLVLRVVNSSEKPLAAQIRLAGFVPNRALAQVTVLAGPRDAVNTSCNPRAIVPQQSTWEHRTSDGKTSYAFPPLSVTVMRVQ